MKKYIFEIPVYRLSEKEYSIEENKFLSNFYSSVYFKKGTVTPLINYKNFKEKSLNTEIFGNTMKL